MDGSFLNLGGIWMKTVREKSEQATLPKLAHAFTVEEFQRLVEAGVVAEDERIELIGGDLIDVTPIGIRHAATVWSPSESPEDGVWAELQVTIRVDSHDGVD